MVRLCVNLWDEVLIVQYLSSLTIEHIGQLANQILYCLHDLYRGLKVAVGGAHAQNTISDQIS